MSGLSKARLVVRNRCWQSETSGGGRERAVEVEKTSKRSKLRAGLRKYSLMGMNASKALKLCLNVRKRVQRVQTSLEMVVDVSDRVVGLSNEQRVGDERYSL